MNKHSLQEKTSDSVHITYWNPRTQAYGQSAFLCKWVAILTTPTAQVAKILSGVGTNLGDTGTQDIRWNTVPRQQVCTHIEMLFWVNFYRFVSVVNLKCLCTLTFSILLSEILFKLFQPETWIPPSHSRKTWRKNVFQKDITAWINLCCPLKVA